MQVRGRQAILVIITHFHFRACLVSFEHRHRDKGYRQNFQGNALDIIFFCLEALLTTWRSY